jgi:hypothetical protein
MYTGDSPFQSLTGQSLVKQIIFVSETMGKLLDSRKRKLENAPVSTLSFIQQMNDLSVSTVGGLRSTEGPLNLKGRVKNKFKVLCRLFSKDIIHIYRPQAILI